ncbi:T9SS type A sorting domain-containing protein [Polaribacter septentrionalilitoris]|uniref:T9SS type A sorting domain-containing protein n=1 Tax=Polaribacter septentrionalilitoris TaxID=2494657 RepID=UPI00135CE2A3|nr:T9SS type A sorting domain-containing protein [Polaribacter septentrionalilitoris]
MRKTTFLIVIFFIAFSTYAQHSAYYINQQTGSNSNDGLTPSTPFKTINNNLPRTVADNAGVAFEIILIGEFTNASYNPSYTFSAVNDPILWNSENTLYFNNFKGEAGKYITIKPYDSTTILKGNGGNILRVANSEYLIIKDLKIEGEVPNIPLSLANDLQFSYLDLSVNEDADPNNNIDRYNPTLAQIRERNTDDCITPDCDPSLAGALPKINNKPLVRPSYVDTRGFYLSKINNIKILNNVVSQMPGGGLRVSDCEDVDIIGNEVSYCSLRSYSGTHGLVVTKATSTRTSDDYRIKIVGNKVHHNYNEQYSWAPDKDKITPHIDEGKGISLQRNQTTYKSDGVTINVNWEHGRILVANNLAYFNGFSGIHSNDGDRVDFINNTAYFNSYTKSITEDNDGNPATFPTSTNGGNIGISMSDGIDCKIINNISVIDSRMSKSAIAVKNSTIATSDATATTRANGIPDVEIKNNLSYGTTLQGVTGTVDESATTVSIQTDAIKADPLFVDPLNFDFRLKITSPAINAADATNATTTDFNEDVRYGTADLGALEFDANVTLWEGNNSSSWVDAGNWSNGVPIDNTYAINVPTGLTNYPEITTANNELKDVYIEAGGTLNINPTGSLTIERDLIQDGTFTIKSDATNSGSFILKGTQKGVANIDYDRYITSNWHLIAPPVEEQSISTFKNSVIKKGNKYSLADYNNKLAGSLKYQYYTDNTGAIDIDNANNFINAKGYAIQKSKAGVLTFSGTLKTDDATILLKDNANKWNLVGNPFTAYIALNSDAHTTDNFLTKNMLNLDPDRVAIYMWNGSSYDIINHATGKAKYAAPGQGFFVESKNNGATLTIPESIQTHQTTKPFYKGADLVPEIKITLTSGSKVKSTLIKYFANATTGLDQGYDAGAFRDDKNNFGIYSHLVSDSGGTNFALQCLPNDNYENMIIPLGLNASKEEEIIFSASIKNFPKSLNVYLEDRETKTFTNLLESGSSFSLILNSDQNSIGRFYLHTSGSTLSLNTVPKESLSFYLINKKTLRLVGAKESSLTVSLYNLLGSKVYQSKLKGNSIHDIKLLDLKPGIYLVKTQSENQILSKKIILE